MQVLQDVNGVKAVDVDKVYQQEVMREKGAATPATAAAKSLPVKVAAGDILYADMFAEPATANKRKMPNLSISQHVGGDLSGIVLWVALWLVGAYSTVLFVVYMYPTLKDNAWGLLIYVGCLGLSFYERAGLPPFYLLWANPLVATYWEKRLPAFLKYTFYHCKMTCVVLSIDVGSTWLGVVVLLAGKHLPLLVFDVEMNGLALTGTALIISLTCAIGPEPSIKKHWGKLRGK